MKRLLAATAALAGLVAAAPLPAATVTVTITRLGFVPSSVTIKTGDAVTFRNTDTAVHQVVFTKTTGVTCTPSPVVIQPTQTASCTFATAGSYGYRDQTDKKLKGTVVVQAAPASLSIAANPLVRVYAGKTTLSGTLSTGQANQRITVEAQLCGAAAATPVADVTTTTGGAWSYVAQPVKATTYSARWKNVASAAVVVKVRPRLRLGKVAPHRYSVRLFASDSMSGKVAFFQRYNASLRRWVTVKRVVLAAGPSAVAPTVVSAATFTARIKARLRVRAVITQAQVGSCYLPGFSNVIFS
jgi:plastocyanin